MKVKSWLHKMIFRIQTCADSILNDISLQHKMIGMYLLCVLLPLVLTDSVILSIIVGADREARQQEMRNTAAAIAYNLLATVDDAVDLGESVYRNRYVNRFIAAEYATPLEYYNSYQAFMKDSLYETVMGSSGYQTVIYADNPGFVNGGYFSRLETVSDSEWYQDFVESGREIMAIPYYDIKEGLNAHQKKLCVVRRMDYYHKGEGGDVLKLELDYGAMLRSLVYSHYANTFYVCWEDRILFSNDGRGGVNMPFERLSPESAKQAGVHTQMEVYGTVWDIYVMDSTRKVMEVIRDNLPLILFLMMVNILLPLLFVKGLNRSFTLRLRMLGETFEKESGDLLQLLPEAKGKDEIGVLMRSYNHMVRRMNELIQTVYKDKLKKQEMDIARQAAELLALHSQINPHFLFNALESIRMHSILKKEYETADMVEKLALMQRQNVEWSSDVVEVSNEVRFVEAYLELQKYRFGERISYRIEVEEQCEKIWVPKLSLVTFVENACVHGMERKSAEGWIFVRVYMREDEMCMEIEDTGIGMSGEQVAELQEKMNGAKIEQLKEKGRVGILNACIRMKMATQDRVFFELESEEGAGTCVMIHIPVEGQKR